MTESFELRERFPVKPSILYDAWLNSKAHTAMTGGEAICSDRKGGVFTAWDGYISGSNKSLKPKREIVQSWRTTEFEDRDEDSELIIRLAEIEEGTELTLIHRNIPEGQTQYKQGWIDHYFMPMRAYFENDL
jgi:activator of HSP90 ATPase